MEQMQWYHPELNKYGAELALGAQTVGTFLLRSSSYGTEYRTLSVTTTNNGKNLVMHYRIEKVADGWKMDTMISENIGALILRLRQEGRLGNPLLRTHNR